MYFDEEPQILPIGSFAKGNPATLEEIWDSSREAQQKLYNDHALSGQLEDEYNQRIGAIRDATGTELTNPINALTPDELTELGALTQNGEPVVGWDAISNWRTERFNSKLRDLAAKHPDQAGIILADNPPSMVVSERMRPVFEHEADVAQRADIDTLGGMVSNPLALGANIGGSVSAWFRMPTADNWSPLATYTQPGTAIIGGASSKATSLAVAAFRNAMANAAGQAAIEPLQQKQLRAIGIEYGTGQTLTNIATAGALGGILDVGIRAPVRAGRAALGDREIGGVFRGYTPPDAPAPGAPTAAPTVPDDLAARAQAGDAAAMAEVSRILDAKPDDFPTLVDKALGGDVAAMRAVGEQAGIMEDPAFRGALHAAEIDAELETTMRSMGIDRGEGLEALVRALKAEAADAPMPFRAPETPVDPIMRLSPEEAGALMAERGAELSRLRSELSKVDAKIAQQVEAAVAAGFEDILPVVRAASDLVAQGVDAANVARSLARQVAEVVDKVGAETFALQTLVHGGRGSPVEAARLIRSGAKVDRGMPLATDYMRSARAMATLSDSAFAMVERGEVSPAVASLIAEHVENRTLHAPLLDDMRAANITDADMALEALPDFLPSNARATNNALLGVGRDTPLGEMPLRAGAEIEDPNPLTGAAAKQIKRLEAELAPELAEAAAVPVERMPQTPAEAVARAAEIKAAIASVAGMVPEGVSIRTFSSVEDLPASVRADVVRASGVSFAEALERYQAATTPEARAKARADLDEIKAGRGIEALTQDASIFLATYAVNPKGRLAHEVVHALKTLGKLGPDEVRILAERGRQTGAFDPGREYLYRQELESRGWDPERIAGVLDEEGAAHVIEARVNGQSFGRGLDSIIDRVLDVLRRVGNALRLRGFDRADQIISAVLTGEVAKRPAVESWMRNADITAAASASPAQIGIGEGGISSAKPRLSRVTTPDGSATYPVRFEVVDASTLKAASGDLQPRDRSTRASSDVQIREMAGRLNPDLLVHSAQSDRGAPIVDDGGVVLSGNGRMAAIAAAKAIGSPGYDAYLSRLAAEGFDVAGLESPVLVRRLADPMNATTKREFVVKSNQDDKLAMSPAELARVDRDLMDDDTLALMDPDGEAGLGSAANRRFVRAVMAKMPAAQQGGLLGEGGSLTPAGVARLEGAVFARAYDDRSLVNRIVEDQEGAGVRNALMAAAPSWAQMRAVASSDFDITRQLVEAVKTVGMMRERRLRPADYFAQVDAFSMPDPVMQTLVRAFYNDTGTRAAAWRTTRDLLKDYARIAMDEGRAVGDLLGAKPTPAEILDGLLRRRGSGDNEPATFFAFAGAKAKTANLKMLAKANDMEGQGKDRAAVWTETGWFRGVDGKWRFEISDRPATFRTDGGLQALLGDHNGWVESLPFDRTISGDRPDYVRLADIFSHPELFDAYPDMPMISVEIERNPNADGTFGWNVLSVREEYLQRALNGQGEGMPAKVVMHELEHAAQIEEGFARGGSAAEFAADPTSALLYDEMGIAEPVSKGEMLRRHLMYRKLAGEVEARLVEKRLRMTPEQRAAQPPWLDYDTPEEKQIVRFSGATSNSATFDAVGSHFQAIGKKLPVGPLFAMRGYGTPRIEAEARKLMAEVADLEARMWKEGANAAEVAAAIQQRFGLTVAPAELAAGRVWWRIDKEIRDEGTRSFAMEFDDARANAPSDELSSAVERNWQRIEDARVQVGTDGTRRTKAAPVRVLTDEEVASLESSSPEYAARSRQRLAEAESAPLTDAQKKEAARLSKAGLKPTQISETMTEAAGVYVPLTSIVAELERVGLVEAKAKIAADFAKGRKLTWSDGMRDVLSDNSLSAEQMAKKVSSLAGWEVPVARITNQKAKMRERGELATSEQGARSVRITPEIERIFTSKSLATKTIDDVRAEIEALVGHPINPAVPYRIMTNLRQKGRKVGSFKAHNADLLAFLRSDEAVGRSVEDLAAEASTRLKRNISEQVVQRVRKEARESGIELPDTVSRNVWPIAARALLLSPETQSWSAKRLAAEVSKVLGRDVPEAVVYRQRDALRKAGSMAPPFRWTDESLALLTSKDVEELTAKELAAIIKERFGHEPSENAIRTQRFLQRKRMRGQGSDPKFAMRGSGDQGDEEVPLFSYAGMDPAAMSEFFQRVSAAAADNVPPQAIADTLRVEFFDTTGVELSHDQAHALVGQFLADGALDTPALSEAFSSFATRAAEQEADDQGARQRLYDDQSDKNSAIMATPLRRDLADLQRMQEMQRLAETCPA